MIEEDGCDKDIYFAAPLSYFSITESLFAVISACLPMMRPLVRYFRLSNQINIAPIASEQPEH
jgi:hypothetical protein